MAFGLYRLKHPLNPSLRTNQKRCPHDPDDLLAVHVLLFQDVEFLGHFFLGVRQKGVRQLFVFFKLE